MKRAVLIGLLASMVFGPAMAHSGSSVAFAHLGEHLALAAGAAALAWLVVRRWRSIARETERPTHNR